jgi:hypothetical protein
MGSLLFGTAMLKTFLPLIALTLAAQTPAPTPPSPMSPKPVVMPGKPAATATEPQDGEVIAYLGRKKVHYGDFTKWLKVMAGPRAEMIRKNPANRAQVQKQYLELQVLAAKGRRDKLQATPEFKALLAALEQQCYARVLMDEDRSGSPMQKLKAKAENPTEEEVRAYFTANSERYATPEKFTARHILVSLKSMTGGRGPTEEEAKAKLAKIQEELKAGKKLEDLAKDFSDDPGSKDKGGLYTDIPYGRFAKEFEEAVRKQDIGQVGEPVKTTFGYHLIQVLARHPKEPADFEKVKDTVRKQMLPERQEKLKQEFMDQAKKEVGYREVSGTPAQPDKPQAAPKAP